MCNVDRRGGGWLGGGTPGPVPSGLELDRAHTGALDPILAALLLRGGLAVLWTVEEGDVILDAGHWAAETGLARPALRQFLGIFHSMLRVWS